MPARDQQHQIGKADPVGQPRGQCVARQMVDPDQRLARAEGDALGAHHARQHPADQPGTGGHRHDIHRRERQPGLGQRLFDRQVHLLGMGAGGKLREAHRARMADRLAGAKPVRPDTNLNRFDPFGLRYVALMLFATGLLFGSIWKADTIAGMAPGRADALAAGPTWEGWVEPPRYTGQPSLYLADLPEDGVAVPKGSKVMVRLYGDVGALTLSETVSGRTGEIGSAADPVQDFEVAQSGTLAIEGPGGRSWELEVMPDSAPQVSVQGERTVICWLSPVEPGMRMTWAPGLIAMKLSSTVPALSNSIESTAIGRISILLMTISFIQIARKKDGPSIASSAEPSAVIIIL